MNGVSFTSIMYTILLNQEKYQLYKINLYEQNQYF